MNYLKAPLIFKIRKVMRYIRLYGLERTYRKIKSQMHLAKITPEQGPWINPNGEARGDVAVVGCGNFAFSTIAYYVASNTEGKIKYCYDILLPRAASLARAFGVYKAITSLDEILEDDSIKLVFIASNHASHATYAVRALEAGKNVHIEKPVAVSLSQLSRLEAAIQASGKQVFLGFNRPKSKLFLELMAQLSRQEGPLMINWFIAGHEIEDGHWYFSEEEGGRVLGNLCHWSDLTLHMVGLANAFPCKIVPGISTGSKSDFVVSITFAEGSQAAITFSAKGHTFEGVREYLNVHRGDMLASLRDFQHLQVDVVEQCIKKSLGKRDHGHKANIVNSYEGAMGDGQGESLEYIRGTSLLVLKIKEALDSGQVILCENKLE